ncbi:MAG: hypothetical protein V7K71_03710 [Nostoc sp.]|uniref:hypothetical protein n=1 Tax=Nostoc sp. TaxID=1180 RepID=UPI002FF4D6B2
MRKADNFTAHALHLETGAKNESNILYEDALMVQEIKNEPPSRSVSLEKSAKSAFAFALASLKEKRLVRAASPTGEEKK